MITTDWEGDHGLPAGLIKGALACSGMYDLEAPRRSYRNEYLRLDDDAVERLSPIRHLPDHGCPLIVGMGGLETDEFRRQPRVFAEAWRAKGLDCRLVEMAGPQQPDPPYSGFWLPAGGLRSARTPLTDRSAGRRQDRDQFHSG